MVTLIIFIVKVYFFPSCDVYCESWLGIGCRHWEKVQGVLPRVFMWWQK